MRLRAWVSAGLWLLSGPLWAQDKAQVMGTKEDRLFWVIPNYRTVDEQRSIAAITAKEKLTIAVRDSFDPYAFPVAGFFAGIAQAEDEYPSWGQGTAGFEKRYFGALADQTVSNMMSEAVFPILLHQDPRFLRLGRGGILHRMGYAASRIFITRGDGGDSQFNASEFGGNAVMAIGSNLYTPRQDRSVGGTASKWGIQLGIDMVFNVFQEFWPDIKQKLTGRRPAP